MILNELIGRGLSVDTGVVVKDVKENMKKRQFEVASVVNVPNTKVYIQSALAITDDKKIQQESASLNSIPDSFKKIVVTGGNYKPWQNEQVIQFVPLFDFLLCSYLYQHHLQSADMMLMDFCG